jgi:hypothetical protein
MLTGKHSDCDWTVRLGRLTGELFVVGKDTIAGIRGHKAVAVLAGVVFLFMIGCTPDSSSSSSGSANSSNTSLVSPLASNSAPAIGGVNDPASDPPGDVAGNSLAGDPGTDPPSDGPSASVPEPATAFLFLCAAGSMALARMRARKDA